MKCIDQKTGRLIVRYELNLLSPEEKEQFENHLLRCDSCFRDLYSFSPILDIMQEQKTILLNELEAKTIEIRNKRTHRPFLEKKKSRSGTRLKFAFAAGFSFVLFFSTVMLITPTPLDYRSIMQNQPPEYKRFELRLKGAFDTANWEKLFDAGMEYYAAADYDSAAMLLRTSFEKNPDNIETQYYLGITYMAISKVDSAVYFLKKASDLQNYRYAESAHWYLGNAYLYKDMGIKALHEFEIVAEMNGEHKEKALERANKIQIELERPVLEKKLGQLKTFLAL